MRLGRTFVGLRVLPKAGRGLPRGRSGSRPPRGVECWPTALQRPPACVLLGRLPRKLGGAEPGRGQLLRVTASDRPGPSPQSGWNTNTRRLKAQLHSIRPTRRGRENTPRADARHARPPRRPGDGSTRTHEGCLGPPAPPVR